MTARRRFACLLTSACLLGLVFTSAAPAAQEVFLRLDGIPGESRDVRFKDTIDVLAFQWGVSATGGVRPAFQNFSFTKRVDQASPLLLQRAAAGQVIPRATVSVRDAGKPQDFLVYCMTDVRVTELSTSGSGGRGPADRAARALLRHHLPDLPQAEPGRNAEHAVHRRLRHRAQRAAQRLGLLRREAAELRTARTATRPRRWRGSSSGSG